MRRSGASRTISVEQDQALSLSKEVDLLAAEVRAKQGCCRDAELVEPEDLPGTLDDDYSGVTRCAVPAVEEASSALYPEFLLDKRRRPE